MGYYYCEAYVGLNEHHEPGEYWLVVRSQYCSFAAGCCFVLVCFHGRCAYRVSLVPGQHQSNDLGVFILEQNIVFEVT